jgi:hypothetical protein
MRRSLVCIGLFLMLGTFTSSSFVSVNEAHAAKASPPTCKYGGKTCMRCVEFEVLPPRRPGQRPRQRCIKCERDTSNNACVIQFF